MPHTRSGRSLLLVAAVAAAVASGVTYLLVRHDSSQAPIVLTGVLRDTSGKPVANALIQLTAMDSTIDKIGARIPVVQLARAHTDAAGRFTLRQAQSVTLIRKLAAANGNWVNFDLSISADGQFMPWSIPRKISHGTWLADDSPELSAALKVEQLTFKPFS